MVKILFGWLLLKHQKVSSKKTQLLKVVIFLLFLDFVSKDLESGFRSMITWCFCISDPSFFRHYDDILGEYKIMAYIKPHVNVLSLHGICCVQKTNELYLVTEFCELGSLKDYLKQHPVSL